MCDVSLYHHFNLAYSIVCSFISCLLRARILLYLMLESVCYDME